MSFEAPNGRDAEASFQTEFEYVAITVVGPDEVGRCYRCCAALSAGEDLHIWIRHRSLPRPRRGTRVTLCATCQEAGVALPGAAGDGQRTEC